MLVSTTKLIQIFCQLDDFCQAYQQKLQHYLLTEDPLKSRHSSNRPRLQLSELMCIEVLYHLSAHQCFEYFYRDEVLNGSLKSCFPQAPSYNRFVELKARMPPALVCYLHLCKLGAALGIYYADSTTLTLCRNQRIPSHKVFSGKAQRGRNSMGWFYGFKLFVVINGFGHMAQAFLTPGHVADNKASVMKRLLQGIKGLVFADKGFINGKAAEELISKGLQLITSVKNTMKNKLLKMGHKLLLRKRGG